MLSRLEAGSTYRPLWAVISREAHSDGTPHLHLVVKWTKKINLRSASALDYLAGQHGSYEAVKDLPGALKYLFKEDPEPLQFGPVPIHLMRQSSGKKNSQEGKEKIGDIVAAALMAGTSIMDILKENKGYTMANLKKMQQLQAFLATQAKERMSLSHQVTIAIGEDVTTQDRTIFEWARDNIFNRKREFKAAQLYIHGPCNHNKTSFVMKLLEVAKYYAMPNDEPYDDFWDDNAYDFAVLDEYAKGQKRSPPYLNRFADGSPTTLSVKGAQYFKMFRAPFVILSNFSPAEIIESHFLAPFLSRFTVVKLEHPIDLSKMSFHVRDKSGLPCTCGSSSFCPPLEQDEE